MSSSLRLLVWSDVHYPFQDETADRILNDFIVDFKPDVAILNGDGVDFYTISRFTKSPKLRRPLVEEIEGWKGYLAIKRALMPNATIHYNGGNHEDRLRKFVYDKAPELAGISGLSIPDLFSLPALDISYTPYHNAMNAVGSPGYDLHGLLVIHGEMVSKWSAASARGHWEKYGGSGVIGHTHRQGEFYHRDYRGAYKWIEAGCMCGLQPEYDAVPNWQQGFAAGYIFPKEGKQVARYDVRPVPIVKGKAVWEGKVYS